MTVCVLPAHDAIAHRPRSCAHLKPRAELRCARAQLRHARAQLRHPTTAHSPARLRYRISHPPIRHLALWLCIHKGEGAWNDDTGNGYYGGLQMTANWGPYGRPLVWHANLLTPYRQMRVAERGYAIVRRAQGYSYARYTWLPGQWYHPECFQYA